MFIGRYNKWSGCEELVSVFQRRRDYVHDGERSAHASLVTSSLKANVNAKIRKNRRVTIF